jgi:nucleoid DNA-binding protein
MGHYIRARGTIFTYGRHGVCHQLANQVLYATGIGRASPLTVTKCRGYLASVYWYGTYGVPDGVWRQKRDSCRARQSRAPRFSGGIEMAHVPDEFESRAREVLGPRDPQLLSALLALRAETQRMVVQQWPGSGIPDAATLNARNQRLLDRAARLLGSKYFEEIFGFPSSQRVNLIDPRVEQVSDVEVDANVRPRTSRRFKPGTGLAAPAARPVVTLKHLAASLAETHELSRKETQAVLDDLVGLVTKHLKKGDRIRIGGLGILQVRKRAGRLGRNPATGEPIKIKASKKVAFRAAKDLKEAI